MLKEYLEQKYGGNNPLIINRLKRDNHLFRQFYTLMKQFDEPVEQLKNYCKLLSIIEAKLPLPSGRVGNPLAVALEMHEYKAALDMIQNPEEYGVSLNEISGGDGFNSWSANDVFDFSLLTFEESLTNYEYIRKIYTDDRWEEMERIKKEEKEAAEEIVKIFSRN